MFSFFVDRHADEGSINSQRWHTQVDFLFTWVLWTLIEWKWIQGFSPNSQGVSLALWGEMCALQCLSY